MLAVVALFVAEGNCGEISISSYLSSWLTPEETSSNVVFGMQDGDDDGQRLTATDIHDYTLAPTAAPTTPTPAPTPPGKPYWKACSHVECYFVGGA